jgi:hypothetical protein
MTPHLFSFFLAAKQEMIKSKLPNNVLGKIWKLSDVDKVSNFLSGFAVIKEFGRRMDNWGTLFKSLRHLTLVSVSLLYSSPFYHVRYFSTLLYKWIQ